MIKTFHQKRGQKGFTLIEMIATLVILGVLASIAVPKYYDLTREAQNRGALQAVVEGKAAETCWCMQMPTVEINLPQTSCWCARCLVHQRPRSQ